MISNTHTRHCCPLHGCKYGDTECVVVTGAGAPEGDCRDCEYEARNFPIRVGSRLPYAVAPSKALVREVDGPTPGVFLFRDGDLGVTVAFPRGMQAATGTYDPAQAHLPPHWGACCTWKWDDALRHARTVEVLMVDLPFSLPRAPRAWSPRAEDEVTYDGKIFVSAPQNGWYGYAGALRILVDNIRKLYEAAKSV